MGSYMLWQDNTDTVSAGICTMPQSVAALGNVYIVQNYHGGNCEMESKLAIKELKSTQLKSTLVRVT